MTPNMAESCMKLDDDALDLARLLLETTDAILPKTVSPELARSTHRVWKASGLPLTNLFPNKKDYQKMRLAFVDFGLQGNLPRAQRLEKQRLRGKARQEREAQARLLRRQQQLQESMAALFSSTVTPSCASASSKASE
jgi:hypothetical protein